MTVSMHSPSSQFELVMQASSADEPILLRSEADPNNATVAFHEELRRLTLQGVTGELIVRKHNGARNPVLRQPL